MAKEEEYANSLADLALLAAPEFAPTSSSSNQKTANQGNNPQTAAASRSSQLQQACGKRKTDLTRLPVEAAAFSQEAPVSPVSEIDEEDALLIQRVAEFGSQESPLKKAYMLAKKSNAFMSMYASISNARVGPIPVKAAKPVGCSAPAPWRLVQPPRVPVPAPWRSKPNGAPAPAPRPPVPKPNGAPAPCVGPPAPKPALPPPPPQQQVMVGAPPPPPPKAVSAAPLPPPPKAVYAAAPLPPKAVSAPKVVPPPKKAVAKPKREQDPNRPKGGRLGLWMQAYYRAKRHHRLEEFIRLNPKPSTIEEGRNFEESSL